MFDNGISGTIRARDYGPARLIVELTNSCNLRCSYCLRDEEALYRQPVNFFPLELFTRVLSEARDAAQIEHVMFTGGEVTLHPRFDEILSAVRAENLKCSFITNGWNFEHVWGPIQAHRETLTHVAFSLDGPTRELHDRWRGRGSFVRLVRAFAQCHASGLPFMVKTVMKRSTLSGLEQMALFAARMGASGITYVHLLPTSDYFQSEEALNRTERLAAEQEVALLARLLKMKVALDVGSIDLDPAAPCSALAGVSCNIDYLGRLSLCCNLSGYRGAAEQQSDLIADLKTESFAFAYARLRALAREQIDRRAVALRRAAQASQEPDPFVALPCLFCLHTFAKIPWHREAAADRALPVISVEKAPACH
jgi:MoaA/NifB/PqqE/SkfB family radical SAM enzyme